MTDPSGRSCPRPARLALVLVAAVLEAGLLALAPAGAARVAAASSTLSLVTATRYDVQPDQHKVHVTVDATARATAVNDPIHAYYFTGTRSRSSRRPRGMRPPLGARPSPSRPPSGRLTTSCSPSSSART